MVEPNMAYSPWCHLAGSAGTVRVYRHRGWPWIALLPYGREAAGWWTQIINLLRDSFICSYQVFTQKMHVDQKCRPILLVTKILNTSFCTANLVKTSEVPLIHTCADPGGEKGENKGARPPPLLRVSALLVHHDHSKILDLPPPQHLYGSPRT